MNIATPNDDKKTYIVHGCGVKDAGQDTEGLNVEGKLRVHGLLEKLLHETSENIVVIFSGGKVEENKGQKFSEAEYMHQYFDKIAQGYDKLKNIIYIDESQSKNSIENIDFALGLVPEDNDVLNIVSSDYHIPRLVATYQNRIEKGGFDINEIDTLYVMSLLKNSPDLAVQAMLEEFRKRGITTQLKQSLIELFGLGLAKVGQEDLLQRIPSNTPLPKVPLEIIKVLLSGKNK